MRFRTWLAVIVFACALPVATGPSAAGERPCERPMPIHLTGESCDPLRPPEISCRVPADVEGRLEQANHNTVQRAADIFSWQTFLALNWPAGEVRGEPDPTAPISGPGPRVWETWKEAFEVYLPDGGLPPPWDAPEPIPEACGGAGKRLVRAAKVSDVVDLVAQALPVDGTLPATLKDQQGRLLRYEIRLNRPLFEYIADPASPLYSGVALYNGIEQAKVDSVEFPVGSQLIKAAWRQIDAAEKPFFHVTEACVCDQAGVDEPENCRRVTMGLAGFHVMTKTASAPQWIWSTFEQVDNVTPTHGSVAPLGDPDCPPERCPPNRQTGANMPSQVRRVVPIPSAEPDCSRPDRAVDDVAELNQNVQEALRELGSPLASYELVGTQWPIPSQRWPRRSASGDEVRPAADDTVFEVLPALLANTTMETFGQNTSSCMGCHAMSRTLSPSRYVSADFSFTLNNAQPRPRGALCGDVEASESCSDSIIPPPRLPETQWDRENWAEILHGYAAATRTFELTRPRYVRAKLHCSSCHLNGGGNRDSAWWVDMWKVYYYPATTRLQDRINGCFERSMNGEAICSTADGPEECAKNPIMRSLILYMGWLTEQFRERYPNRQPCRGFPPFRAGGGDYERGRQIYVQKCSFCHNAQGQGRYESHTYFRPALWGSRSFNACAGMAKVADLGAFVRWNMPYTSGGMLTAREANDVATYIDAQCRPGKGGLGPDGEPCSLSPSCVDGKQPGATSTPAKIVTSDPPTSQACPEFKAMVGASLRETSH